jgi:hypothetical protein
MPNAGLPWHNTSYSAVWTINVLLSDLPKIGNANGLTSLAEGWRFERRLMDMFALDDQKEGLSAFVEMRKPVFKNKLP